MLKALYDYGLRRQLTLPPGFIEKTVKAYISLSEDDDRVSIYLGDDEQLLCPDMGSLAQGRDKCSVLVEKRSIVVPDAPADGAKPAAKSAFFLETLRDASEEEPLLKTCVRALETPEIAEAIRAELNRMKIKPGDRISFRVNGNSMVESENIRRWWREYRKRFAKGDASPTELCLITGEPTAPMMTTTPIQGLRVVGGHASGDALICFDKAAFCSYNQKKAVNAPVSEEAFGVVKPALDDLLKDAPILAGMKFVHWFDREIAQEEDLFCTLDFGFDRPEQAPETVPVNPATKRNMADQVPESVYSGQAAPDLDGTSYYILLLSGVNSRVMIRRFERGSYADLRQNLRQWYDDLALTNQSGTRNIKPVKLTARLLRLLKFQKGDTRPLDRLSKELAGLTPAVIQAVLSNGALPDAVAAKALAYIRSELLSSDDSDKQSTQSPLPNSLACQWLKVWLIRKRRMRNEEENLMEYYEPNFPNAAYHCGAWLAVYANLQRAAMGDVNATLVQRFYASASRTPALVFGTLDRMGQVYLDILRKEKRGLDRIYEDKLNAVCAFFGSDLAHCLPTTLNLEGQSYFALGYHQMCTQITGEIRKRIADKQEG